MGSAAMPILAAMIALVVTFAATAAADDTGPHLVRCKKSRWEATFRVQHVPPNKATLTCEDVCASEGHVCQTVVKATTCDEYNAIDAGSIVMSSPSCKYKLAPGRACNCATPQVVSMMTNLSMRESFGDYLTSLGEPDVRTCVEGLMSNTLLVLEMPGEPAFMPTCHTICAESSVVRGRCVGHMREGAGLKKSCKRFQAEDSIPNRASGAAGMCKEPTPSNTACLCASEKPLLCGTHRGAAVIISAHASTVRHCAAECALAGLSVEDSPPALYLGKGYDSCQEAMRGKSSAPYRQAVGRACTCLDVVGRMTHALAVQRVCATWPGETRVAISERLASFSCDEMCAVRDDFSPLTAVCGGLFQSNWSEGVCMDEVLVESREDRKREECGLKLSSGGERVCRCIASINSSLLLMN